MNSFINRLARTAATIAAAHLLLVLLADPGHPWINSRNAPKGYCSSSSVA